MSATWVFIELVSVREGILFAEFDDVCIRHFVIVSESVKCLFFLFFLLFYLFLYSVYCTFLIIKYNI